MISHYSRPRRYGKPLLILVSFVACMLVVNIAYNVFLRQPAPRNVSPPPPPALSNLLAAIAGQTMNQYPYLTLSHAQDQTDTIGYQPANYSFAVLIPYNATNTLTFADPQSTTETAAYSQLSAASNLIRAKLKAADFTTDTTQTPVETAVSSVSFYVYGDNVCQLAVYTELNLTCGSKTGLTTIAQQAVSLVGAYQAAAPSLGQTTIAAPDIEVSKTPGYRIATMTVYNSSGATAANFYSTNNGTWSLVDLGWYNDPHEDGDIMPNCADFESDPAVRAAFVGEACYDSADRNETTIQ